MTETIAIEGMSCGHCVKAVESALRAVVGVTSVRVVVGRAEVEGTAPRTRLVEAIRAADFEVSEAR